MSSGQIRTDPQAARDACSDVIWWLCGYACAARKRDRARIEDMARNLALVQQFIDNNTALKEVFNEPGSHSPDLSPAT